MAFDERLAGCVRESVAARRGVEEKKMFGGLAFLDRGRMFCGVLGDNLVVRVGSERHDELISKPHVRPMDFTGRPMKGFLYVDSAGCRTQKDIEGWIEIGLAGAAAASAKKAKRRIRKKDR